MFALHLIASGSFLLSAIFYSFVPLCVCMRLRLTHSLHLCVLLSRSNNSTTMATPNNNTIFTPTQAYTTMRRLAIVMRMPAVVLMDTTTIGTVDRIESTTPITTSSNNNNFTPTVLAEAQPRGAADNVVIVSVRQYKAF